MKILIAVILLHLVAPTILFAQKNLREGTIFLENDTIHGFIKNTGESKIKYQIEFKHSINEKTVIYSASDIYGFEIGNKKYISKEIILNNKKTIIFLEYLVDGVIDLFFLRDKNDYHFYISNADSIIELKNTESIIVRNGQSYYKPNNEYKQLLTNIFIDVPELTLAINELKYTHKDLIEITKQYHDIKYPDKTCTIYNKKEESKANFEFAIGTRFSDSNSSYQANEQPFFLNHSPSIHLSYSKSSLAGFSNLEQVVGIGYFNNKIETKNKSLIFNNISIPVYLKLHKPLNKIDPFFKFGFENTFHFGRNLKNAETTVHLIKGLSVYQLWAIIGFGAEITYLKHTFFTESTLALGRGLNRTIYSETNYIYNDNINLEFLVGYKF